MMDRDSDQRIEIFEVPPEARTPPSPTSSSLTGMASSPLELISYQTNSLAEKMKQAPLIHVTKVMTFIKRTNSADDSRAPADTSAPHPPSICLAEGGGGQRCRHCFTALFITAAPLPVGERALSCALEDRKHEREAP